MTPFQAILAALSKDVQVRVSRPVALRSSIQAAVVSIRPHRNDALSAATSIQSLSLSSSSTTPGSAVEVPQKDGSEAIEYSEGIDFAKQPIVQIPPEIWLASEIDWENSAIEANSSVFHRVHFSTEAMIAAYPIPSSIAIGRSFPSATSMCWTPRTTPATAASG